jgi:hypothetical protein
LIRIRRKMHQLAKGHVQLSSSTSSTSTSLAATASAVKTVKDEAKAYTDAHEQKAAPHSGHETPAGAQAKADAAETNAKSHANGLVGILSSLATTAKNNIVAAINEIHSWLGQLDNDFDAHQAEKATDEKLGHVAVDGESIIANDAGVIFAHPIIDDTQHKPQIAISTLFQMCAGGYGGSIYAIAVDDSYVYVSGTTTQTVKKFNKTNLSQVAESESYGGHMRAIAVDDNYVYVGGFTSQTVKKINKTNLSLVAMSASYGGNIYALAQDDNYIYVGGDDTQKVYKLNKSNLSKVAESANYGGPIYAIAVDDSYVYVGGRGEPRTVKKLKKSDLSQVAESADYGGEMRAIAVDDSYVYVSGTTTQTVKKFNKTNLSQVAESANYGGEMRAIAVDDNYIYVGGDDTQTVKKLNKIQPVVFMPGCVHGPG